jgi:hypothetical protein
MINTITLLIAIFLLIINILNWLMIIFIMDFVVKAKEAAETKSNGVVIMNERKMGE